MMKAELLHLFAVFALLDMCCGDCGQKVTVCPLRFQQFISENATLLPEGHVQASSEDATFNPVQNFVDVSSPPWCTAQENATRPGHFIDLNFTEPIVLTYVKSSGFINGYVDNFTIGHTMSAEGEEFTVYGVTEVQQEFYVQGTEGLLLTDAHFILEKAVVARRLRFYINGGVPDPSHRLCWEVMLFGCTLLEAVSIGGDVGVHRGSSTSPPTLHPTPLPPTPSPSPTLSDASSVTPFHPAGCSAAPDALTNQKMLTIVVPVAVGTVVMVAVIVGVGVALCFCIIRNRDKRKNAYDTVETVTVKMVEHVPTLPYRRDSQASILSSGAFHYDVPRPLMYDVPRASRCTSSSGTPLMEFQEKQNGLDNRIDSDGNDYEIIPDFLPSTETHVYSAPPSISGKEEPTRPHSSTAPSPRSSKDKPTPTHTYAIVDKKSKINGMLKETALCNQKPGENTQTV